MPQVGELTIGITARTEQLDRGTKNATRSVQGFAASVERESARAGASWDTFAKRSAKALSIGAASINAFGVESQNATAKVLGMGAQIGLAFAIGGPILGGIAIAATAIGHFAGKAEDARKKAEALTDAAFKRAMGADEVLRALQSEGDSAVEKTVREIDRIDQRVQKLKAEIQFTKTGFMDFGAVGVLQAELATLEQINGKLQAKFRLQLSLEQLRQKELTAQFDRQISGMRAEFAGTPSNEIALLQQIEVLEAKRKALIDAQVTGAAEQIRELDLQIAGTEELLGVTREINRARADRSLTKEIELLVAITDEQRRQVELAQRMEDLRRGGASEALIEQFASLKAREPILQFWRSVTDSIGQSLTDAIMDGIETGFQNGTDVARNPVNQLLRMVLSSVIQSGLQSIFGSIFGGGSGGGGLTGALDAVVGAVTGGGGGSGGASVAPLPGDC